MLTPWGGLAGGGALVLVLAVLSAIAQPVWAVAYILLFGLGSVPGMLVAVSLTRVPFTLRMQLGGGGGRLLWCCHRCQTSGTVAGWHG